MITYVWVSYWDWVDIVKSLNRMGEFVRLLWDGKMVAILVWKSYLIYPQTAELLVDLQLTPCPAV